MPGFRTSRRLSGLAVLSIVTAACTTTPGLPDPLEAGWEGGPVCERLHEDDSQRVLRCTFAPTVGHERHFHAPHFGYAIAGGRVRITDGNGVREVEFPTGSHSVSEGVDWHEIVNIGNTTIVYLLIEPK